MKIVLLSHHSFFSMAISRGFCAACNQVHFQLNQHNNNQNNNQNNQHYSAGVCRMFMMHL